MRAAERRIVTWTYMAVVCCAVSLAVAGCAVTSSAATGNASRKTPADSLRPGVPSKVKLSPAPRAASFPATGTPVRHRRITGGHSGRVILTAADDGATVVVAGGQEITVVLTGLGTLGWNPPRLAGSESGVLRVLSSSGGYPSEQPARVSYRALQAGTAQIVSETNARCLHAHPACTIPQRSWRVTVIVR